MLINSEIPILHYILNRLGIVYVMQKQLCYVAALMVQGGPTVRNSFDALIMFSRPLAAVLSIKFSIPDLPKIEPVTRVSRIRDFSIRQLSCIF